MTATRITASTPSKLQLGLGLVDLQRVAAGEAGVAVPRLGAVVVADGAHHALQRQELEAVGADPLTDLLERQPGRHQVAVVAHVDAEVARVHDRRAGDAHVHLGRPGVADQLDERPGGRAPHERVVDHHDPPAGQVLGEGVELQGHAAVADLLRRLDERAPDVAVLDQPVVERHAARPGVPDGGGDRGVGHRDHDVGVGRRLGGQLGAEPLARLVHVAAVPHRVGTGEVDELERAAGLPRRRGERRAAAQLGALQRDDLTRLDLADVDAAERRQGARLAGDGVPAVRQPPDRQRAEAPRVAHGEHPVGGQQDEREGALPRRQRALDALLPRPPAGGGEHQRHHLGVARRRQPEALRQQLVAQLRRVDDVAVVGERQRAVHRLDEERLDVALVRRTGRRVAGVADGVVAGQRLQRLVGEDVRHQAGLLVDAGAVPVADGDAGGLLAAVLQGEQAEERQLGDALAVRGRDADHATLLSWYVAGDVELPHVHSCRRSSRRAAIRASTG